jgi:hypothetical protein
VNHLSNEEMDGIFMKKLTIISLLVLALVLTGCNFPGSQDQTPEGEDDSMATEIARILTGTPVEAETTPTLIPTQIPPTSTTKPTEEKPEPTPTNTLSAEVTPTLSDDDPAADLGEPDWVDDMANGDNWPTGVNKFTTIAFKDGFLKLTAETTLDGWRLSWPFLKDFYLEATMETPACDSSDHYGLMFRVPANASANKGYLFGISCDGTYSLRRWDGQTMYFPINWTASEAILEGEDVVNKLGIMARGSEIALYINGQKVNEVTDNAYLEGSFGIFVGSINADDFTVWVDQVRYWENP